MPIKIEQITKIGLVVEDYDVKISPIEIKKLLSNQKYLEIRSNKNPYIAKYKNKEIVLCVKSISYLGISHFHHKKRIQIPKEWKDILQQTNTLLLGIYKYDKKVTFCLFDTTKYKNNRLNNSSAHIHTMDIHKARENGVFNKIDNKGNEITVFTEQNFEKVFDSILLGNKITLPSELNIFNEFSESLPLEWKGVDCYTEMMNADFNQAYQPEWSGFYLEYKFEEFLQNNLNYKNICQYKQNKKNNEIDLDLWFNDKQFYGDLKAHTEGGTLLGNDKDNINLALQKYQKVWYIVFAHTTIKDNDRDGIVTKLWNKKLNERYEKTGKGKFKKLDSYLPRMKNSIQLKYFVVLEINQFNKQYLADFNQGGNSNNSSRKQKISIKNEDINNDNFAIYRKTL
jgi:hypothetical protein